jgi:tetratricopeptide (TPR) repeat protein
LAALLVASFLSALILYLGYETFALSFTLISWVAIYVLWSTDRIVFDGRRVIRTGWFPRMWAVATGTRDRLKVNDMEQVETAVFPGVKRGRNVYYTYRTTITGKTARFVFSSGYRGYPAMIQTLLPRLSEDILDNASIDIRDYLIEKRELLRNAKESEIPSSEVLDGSFREIRLGAASENRSLESSESSEKANRLRRLGNQLRLAGRSLQALEAFRRAAILRPRDAHLLFEFAACVRSLAGSEQDPKLEQKALALLRLAERHAAEDRDLLARIGECYSQIGEWRRAAIVFKRVADVFGDNFRTFRGMAELALREGKIAHVIHNFAAAEQQAKSSSLKRWTKTEVEYFSHLNSDEEYMELEISRVNLLDTLERTKRSALRLAIFGFVVIGFGIGFADDLVANIGWAVSGVSLVVWIVMILMTRMLSPRIPFELVESDE